MEITLIALVIIGVVITEKRNDKKQLKQRHARCRRLTYSSNSTLPKNGVISFRGLSEKAALLRSVRSCCRGG